MRTVRSELPGRKSIMRARNPGLAPSAHTRRTAMRSGRVWDAATSIVKRVPASRHHRVMLGTPLASQVIGTTGSLCARDQVFHLLGGTHAELELEKLTIGPILPKCFMKIALRQVRGNQGSLTGLA